MGAVGLQDSKPARARAHSCDWLIPKGTPRDTRATTARNCGCTRLVWLASTTGQVVLAPVEPTDTRTVSTRDLPIVCHVFLEHFSTTATHTPHVTNQSNDPSANDATRCACVEDAQRLSKQACPACTQSPPGTLPRSVTEAQGQDISKRRHSCAQRRSFDAGPERRQSNARAQPVLCQSPSRLPRLSVQQFSFNSFQPSTTARSAFST